MKRTININNEKRRYNNYKNRKPTRKFSFSLNKGVNYKDSYKQFIQKNSDKIICKIQPSSRYAIVYKVFNPKYEKNTTYNLKSFDIPLDILEMI